MFQQPIIYRTLLATWLSAVLLFYEVTPSSGTRQHHYAIQVNTLVIIFYKLLREIIVVAHRHRNLYSLAGTQGFPTYRLLPHGAVCPLSGVAET